MEVDISEKILDWDCMWLTESKALAEGLAQEGLVSFEDALVTLNHAIYKKDSRNISLQCINVKGNHAIEKWGSKIKIRNSNPSDVMELHWETKKYLTHIVENQERENAPYLLNPLLLFSQWKNI